MFVHGKNRPLLANSVLELRRRHFRVRQKQFAQGLEGALVDAVLSLTDVDQYACGSIACVPLRNPSLQTTLFLLGCRHNRGQEPRPCPGWSIKLRYSARGLNQGGAVYGVNGLLDQLIS